MNGTVHRLCLFLTAVTLLTTTITSRAEDLPKLAKLKIAADAGDADAQCQLADYYIMRSDANQADEWLRKSANQGYAPSQGKLGSRLFMRYKMTPNLQAEAKTALGQEALTWLTLGANQGDTLAQGDLADVFYEGKLVKQDLIAAYKWGALASKGPMLNTGTFTGRRTRAAAILKMNADQIDEANRQVAAFTPKKLAPPKPTPRPLPAGLKLKGISGTAAKRYALINDKTLVAGETATVLAAGKSLSVRCIEVRESSAVIEIDGFEGPRELKLQ